jgi:hypothetical protein
MTQRQQQIIEEYLFDVFVKLEGNGEKSKSWWNQVFILEAITSMGQHDYKIASFCEPCDFFQLDDAEDNDDEDAAGAAETEEETNHDYDDDDSFSKFTITRRHEAVDNYLENYYQHEDYYYYFMIAATGERGKASEQEQVLQQQYLYVYTLENSEYFMNKFIYGDDVMLK